jgi:hypothetical protein
MKKAAEDEEREKKKLISEGDERYPQSWPRIGLLFFPSFLMVVLNIHVASSLDGTYSAPSTLRKVEIGEPGFLHAGESKCISGGGAAAITPCTLLEPSRSLDAFGPPEMPILPPLDVPRLGENLVAMPSNLAPLLSVPRYRLGQPRVRQAGQCPRGAGVTTCAHCLPTRFSSCILLDVNSSDSLFQTHQ